MNNQNTIFTTILLVLGCVAVSPVTQARQLSEDRGNGNSAAENVDALNPGTTGSNNTAHGWFSLFSNTTGSSNTADGFKALYSNTEGGANTANGVFALLSNSEGSSNTAIGDVALANNTTGSFNTAKGAGAGAGVETASNVICIGHPGQNLSNRCYIGNIFGAISSGGAAVFINSEGKLGTTTSSRRFKEEIKPMEQASEALYALKPVTFRYKSEIDPERIPQFGLVAEDVEAINPDLVVRDKKGKPYTVRYDAVNAMLLNEFLKEHRKVQEQEATIAELKSTIEEQQNAMKVVIARLEEQAAQIQKVSAELEVSRPAPQVACLPAVVRQPPDECRNNPQRLKTHYESHR
jgi:hypothetical protein